MKRMCPRSQMPHVPKCMSCHNTIEVINGRAYCFHDSIYITRSSSAKCEHSVCCGSLMTTYIYNSQKSLT